MLTKSLELDVNKSNAFFNIKNFHCGAVCSHQLYVHKYMYMYIAKKKVGERSKKVMNKICMYRKRENGEGREK